MKYYRQFILIISLITLPLIGFTQQQRYEYGLSHIGDGMFVKVTGSIEVSMTDSVITMTDGKGRVSTYAIINVANGVISFTSDEGITVHTMGVTNLLGKNKGYKYTVLIVIRFANQEHISFYGNLSSTR